MSKDNPVTWAEAKKWGALTSALLLLIVLIGGVIGWVAWTSVVVIAPIAVLLPYFMVPAELAKNGYVKDE